MDALELAKQSEQSLNNLLDLKEEDEYEDNILLEIDSQLDSKKKGQTGKQFTKFICNKLSILFIHSVAKRFILMIFF